MHSSRMCTANSSGHGGGGGGVVLPQCMLGYTPLGVGLETPPPGQTQLPPWVWAWRPHLARPLNFPPGCGPGNLQGMQGHPPPTCCKACWDTTPPPREHNLAPTSLWAVKMLRLPHRQAVFLLIYTSANALFRCFQ